MLNIFERKITGGSVNVDLKIITLIKKNVTNVKLKDHKIKDT